MWKWGLKLLLRQHRKKQGGFVCAQPVCLSAYGTCQVATAHTTHWAQDCVWKHNTHGTFLEVAKSIPHLWGTIKQLHSKTPHITVSAPITCRGYLLVTDGSGVKVSFTNGTEGNVPSTVAFSLEKYTLLLSWIITAISYPWIAVNSSLWVKWWVYFWIVGLQVSQSISAGDSAQSCAPDRPDWSFLRSPWHSAGGDASTQAAGKEPLLDLKYWLHHCVCHTVADLLAILKIDVPTDRLLWPWPCSNIKLFVRFWARKGGAGWFNRLEMTPGFRQ